jgi:glycine betaine catabolism B
MEFAASIISIISETHDTKTIRVARPKDFYFLPGEYCILSLVDNSKFDGESRPFTISSSPTSKDFLDFTVKKMNDFSSEMLLLKIGDKINVRGPQKAKLVFTEKITEDIGFIAGGSGITPFMSIIRYIVSNGLKNNVTLFYSSKSEKDIIFKSELSKLPPNIKVINTLTDEISPEWTGEKGFVSKEMIGGHVDNPSSLLWYICGPPRMVDAMKKMLNELEIPAEKIITEDWQLP